MAEKRDSEFYINEFKPTAAVDSADMSGIRKKKKKRFFRPRNVILLLALIVVLGGGYFLYQTSSAFDRMTGQNNSLLKSIAKMIPLGNNFFQILPVESSDASSAAQQFKDGKLDRLNILVLGYRGVDDPNGGLLTDSMMVLSIKKSTGEVALISVPRDLYVTLPHSSNKGKLNEAYALGTKNGGWKDALAYSKEEIETVTGLDIPYVASIDFTAFKEIVNTVGGVTIYLDQPFVEKVPFAEGSISLPAGKNTLSGDKALLYSRARESSSDFDRVRRQQQVLVGVKEKALSLGIMSNPTKLVSILNSLGNHVRTNAELWELQEIAGVAMNADTSNIKHRVFDTTPQGLLYETHASNGAYILLPEGGTYDKIKEACQNVFSATDTKTGNTSNK
jgi:LCP family protein required for cell wall assembly